jgi:type I restriction enzyme S subunit
MEVDSKVGDHVKLQRGITYKGNLVGKPGPALLGLGAIHPGGGFREGDYKTYGGECPPSLLLYPTLVPINGLRVFYTLKTWA